MHYYNGSIARTYVSTYIAVIRQVCPFTINYSYSSASLYLASFCVYILYNIVMKLTKRTASVCAMGMAAPATRTHGCWQWLRTTHSASTQLRCCAGVCKLLQVNIQSQTHVQGHTQPYRQTDRQADGVVTDRD